MSESWSTGVSDKRAGNSSNSGQPTTVTTTSSSSSSSSHRSSTTTSGSTSRRGENNNNKTGNEQDTQTRNKSSRSSKSGGRHRSTASGTGTTDNNIVSVSEITVNTRVTKHSSTSTSSRKTSTTLSSTSTNNGSQRTKNERSKDSRKGRSESNKNRHQRDSNRKKLSSHSSYGTSTASSSGGVHSSSGGSIHSNNLSHHHHGNDRDDEMDSLLRQQREKEEEQRDQERIAMMNEEELVRTIDKIANTFIYQHHTTVQKLEETYRTSKEHIENRSLNIPPRLGDYRSSNYKKANLKADLKKSMGVAKRVISMSEESLTALLKDIATINLSRYSCEIALTIGSDKSLKLNDIDNVLQVCSAMHIRYSDFTPVLIHTVCIALATAADICGYGTVDITPSSSSSSNTASSSSSGDTAIKKATATVNPILTSLQQTRNRCPLNTGDLTGIDNTDGNNGVTVAAISTAAVGSVDKDAKTASLRFRVLFRLMYELYSNGIFTDTNGFLSLYIAVLGETGKEGQSLAVTAVKTVNTNTTTALFTNSNVPTDPVSILQHSRTPSFHITNHSNKSTNASSSSSSSAGPFQLTATPVQDKQAKRCTRELPIILTLLKHVGEELLGIPSAKTRTWLTNEVPRKVPTIDTQIDPRTLWANDTLQEFSSAAEPRLTSEPTISSSISTKEVSHASSISSSAATAMVSAVSYPAAWIDARTGTEPSPILCTPVTSYEHALTILKASDAPPLSSSYFHNGHLQLKSNVFSVYEQSILLAATDRYCDAVLAALLLENTALRKRERKVYLAQFQKDISERATQDLETFRESYDRLKRAAMDLAEILDRELPNLPTGFNDLEDEEGTMKGSLLLWSGFISNNLGPFDSEAERAFYRDIVDLPEFVPAALLDPESAKAAQQAAAVAQAQANAAASAQKSKVAYSNRHEGTSRKGTLEGALSQLYGRSLSIPTTTTSNASSVSNVTAVSTTTQNTTPSKTSVPKGSNEKEESTETNVTTAVDDDDDDGSSIVGTTELQEIMTSDDGEAAIVAAAIAAAAVSSSGTPNKTGNASTPSITTTATDNDTATGSAYRLHSLLELLRKCGSKETIDEWATRFFMQNLNTRRNRQRLQKFLFNAPSSYTDLYPYYARLAAIMETGIKDFTKPLVTLLSEEFKFLMRKRPGSFQDLKIKDIRMLGELVKFGICPPSIIFRCAKLLLDDFSPPAIEIASILISTCGRYLYLTPESRDTCTRLLEAMKKEKLNKKLTGNLAIMIDDAWYTCIPSDRPVRKVKVRPPLHSFFRYLLLEYMNENNADECLKIVRKLPWTKDPLIPRYLCKTIMSATRIDGNRQENIASLLSGLRTYHEGAVCRIVDALCDTVITALENGPPGTPSGASNDPSGVLLASTTPVTGVAQRVVGAVRLFAYLYVYELFESPAVFRLAYIILNFGHAIPEQQRITAINNANSIIAQAKERERRKALGLIPEEDEEGDDDEEEDNDGTDEENNTAETTVNSSYTISKISTVTKTETVRFPDHPLVLPPIDPGVGGWGFHPLIPNPADPVSNTFRIRLICELLNICGPYYAKGIAAVRLDRLLVYFQRYALTRQPMPMDSEFDIAELFERIRPKMRRFRNFAEAEVAASKLEQEEAFTAAELAGAATTVMVPTSGKNNGVGDGNTINPSPSSTGTKPSPYIVNGTRSSALEDGEDDDDVDDDDDDDDDDDEDDDDDDDDDDDEEDDDANDEENIDNDEENEEGEDDGDDVNDDENQSEGNEDDDDEENENDEDADEDDDDDEDSDDDDDNDIGDDDEEEQPPEELDDLDMLLKQTISASLEKARTEAPNRLSAIRSTMTIPTNLYRGGTTDLMNAANSTTSSSGNGILGTNNNGAPSGGLRLMVLQRQNKGGGNSSSNVSGKIEAHAIEVPRSTALAEASLRGAQEAQAEHRETKLATLRLVEQQEQEENDDLRRRGWNMGSKR